MIGIRSKRVARHVTKKVLRATTIALFLSIAACSSSSTFEPSDEKDDGIFGTGIQLNGTVSTQYALARDSIEYKRQSGEKGTATLQSDSTFAATQVQGTGAVLLRATTNTGDSLYALALPSENAEINQNIHSYSDLVARNWFASNGLDINSVFDGSGELTAVPTENELQTLEQTVSQIFSAVQDDYNLNGANIFSDQYPANGVGIDGFLLSNPVLINNGVINIFFVDPSTNIQSPVASSLNVSNSLLVGDTENPSAPDDLRALPAASDEIIVLWDPAMDNVAVTRYEVYRDGSLLDSTPYPVFVDESITPGTEYTYFVVAIDSSGNQSSASQSVSAQTLTIPDTIAPTLPANLMLQPAVGSIALSWSQAEDDVASFIVSRAENTGVLTEYLSVTSPSMTDLNVVNGTQYCYQVTAVDGSGNRSIPSEVGCAVSGGEVVNPESGDATNTEPEGQGTNNPVNIGIGTDGIYTLGNCGADISTVASSADINAPARLVQGLVAGGTVVPNSDQQNHYWSFDVPQGEYALVVEGFNGVDTRATNIILNVTETDSRGIEQAQLFRFNAIDNRVREIIPVTADSTGFHVKIAGNVVNKQDYQIVLYTLDDVIPSPYLADCPEVSSTSVGTTEAFTIEANKERYFLVELPVGEYELLVDAAVADGSSTNIIYELSAYSLTNSTSTERQLVRVNEIDTFYRSAVTITSEVGGLLFLRWHKNIKNYNFEFTISRL